MFLGSSGVTKKNLRVDRGGGRVVGIRILFVCLIAACVFYKYSERWYVKDSHGRGEKVFLGS